VRHRKLNGAVRPLPGVAALCVLAMFPAGAFAATANTRIMRIFYTAGPGEANSLTISLDGANYTLADAGAAITAEPACSGTGGAATCPAAGINGITVSAADAADSIVNTTSTRSTLSGGDGNDSLEGGSGNDILRGNKGVDTHAGGAGDDFIDARGDRGDIVTCGDGNDTVLSDGADSIAPDCETVDRGGAPAPDPTAGPSPTAQGLLGPTEARTLKRGACANDRLGTPGDDRLVGTSRGDSIFGLQGKDSLRGLRRDDCLFGGVGSDRMSGGRGDDRLLGDDADRGVGGSDRLSGNAGNDLLVGRSGSDRLSGNAGNDRLIGGRGRNRLRGGAGNDRLDSVNGSSDRLDCGRGRDRARVDRIDRVRGCERVSRRR
jgi:Ca2+-binding RTX toxin-like protein